MASKRGRLVYFSVEAALILVSVLLAFWLNAWREQRATESRVATVRQHFLQEMKQNARSLESVIPYHRAVCDNARRLSTDTQASESIGASDWISTLRTLAPEGMKPPGLERTAWETALAAQTLQHFDYQTLSMLSGLYRLQEFGVQSTWPKILDEVFSVNGFMPERWPATMAFFSVAIDELVRQEEYLLQQIKSAIQALEPHSP